MTVSQPLIVPPHVPGDVATFARVLVAAARTWQMYSPEHPASSAVLVRLKKAVDALLPYPGLSIGVTPKTFMVNGEALPADARLSEAADLLHEHDVLRLRFLAPTTNAVLSDFLRILMQDAEEVRTRGGPARLWKELGHQSLEIDQIDFEGLMADRKTATRNAAQSSVLGDKAGSAVAPADPTARDGIWAAIVRSMSSGLATKGLSVQHRLLEIARSAEAIEALAIDATLGDEETGPNVATMAAQAATVLTTFQRLVRAVEAQSPDEVDNTLRNLAEAASHLDPQLVMRAVGESAESGMGTEVTTAMGRWFDDDQVAHMLARSLAAEGRASGRMAAALSTLAPDPVRRQRVLRMARDYSTRDMGKVTNGLDTAWHALEQLLSGSGASAYTSTEYAVSLDDAESRSYQLSLTTPAQMDGWIQTVSSDSVRTMSSVLLLDLFSLEERPSRITETADDLAAVAEDLLMAADTVETERIVNGLAAIAVGPSPGHAQAASKALHSIAVSKSICDMGATLADFDDAQLAWFDRICHQLGVPVLASIVASMVAASEGEGRRRLEQVIVAFGDPAVAPVARLLENPDWPLRRAAIHCLGRIGTVGAIAVLQKLIGDADASAVHETVAALMRIDDPSALRPVASALRDGPPGLRLLVVGALAASHERRASPLLAAALDETDPFGPGYELVLLMLGALRIVGDDKAVPAIARMLRAWSWRRLARTNRVKRSAASVLASMKSDAARGALDAAIRGGDVLARRHARAARGGGA